jgi:hypothetical protein
MQKGIIMSLKIISEINKFSGFCFNREQNMVVSMKSHDSIDIDEFLKITELLDNNRVQYIMGNNFSIKVLNKK